MASKRFCTLAISVKSIHEQARKHYGFQRTAMQMMQKFEILQRREGERFNCLYNRVMGFQDENMLKLDDPIQITNNNGERVAMTEDKPSSGYARSSHLVLALYITVSY